MALFGGWMRRGVATPQVGGMVAGQIPPMPTSALKQDPFSNKQGGTEQVRSAAGGSATPGAAGGGWRGAFMRKNIPRTLQILGATLQQIDNPQGQLDALAQNEAERVRYEAEQAAQGRSQKIEESQRLQLEQAISSLPPEQQTWARMNPEAFAQAMARAQAGGGWQSGQGYSHLWRPNSDGTVTLGDPLPLRPRQGVQYNAPDDEDWEEF